MPSPGGPTGNVYVAVETTPIQPPGFCRVCKEVAHAADTEGPVHACCLMWRAVVDAGGKCPSCVAGRSGNNAYREKQEQRRGQ
jgi:hypothetical protein